MDHVPGESICAPRIVLVVVALLPLLTPAPSARAGCSSDDDCKGSRVCVEGSCVEAAVADLVCQDSSECGGGEVCVASLCYPVLPGKEYILTSDPDASFTQQRLKTARGRLAAGFVVGLSGFGLTYAAMAARYSENVPAAYTFALVGIGLIGAGVPLASTGGKPAREAVRRMGLTPPNMATRVVAWAFWGVGLLVGGAGFGNGANMIHYGFIEEGLGHISMGASAAGVLGPSG
ncbi:MAG: hypothetical protein QGH45_15055 [Myxococcota bacterium]|jgi:hypothetical protein|nr:hypothetical protein [Myxococcota bacterium]